MKRLLERFIRTCITFLMAWRYERMRQHLRNSQRLNRSADGGGA